MMSLFTSLFFEPHGDALGRAILLILFLFFGVPILLFTIGIILFVRKRKKSGKIVLIIAGVYALISGGICLSMFV